METISETPAPKLDARRSSRWLLVALLFVLLRAIPNISYPMGRDQATYGVIGQGLLNGQQLYLNLWDNKPPGIFALYALLVKAFGHVMWSVGLVDILWLLILSYCIFRFSERYLGPGAAVIAVVVNAAWHTNLGYVDAAQPECFLMVAVFLGFFIASSRKSWPMTRQFVAGLLMGAAFWLKYNALAFFPLVALVPYVDWARLDLSPRQLRFLVPGRVWLERTGALLAGFLVAIGAVLAYFHWAGSWPAMKEVQFHVLPRYAAIAVERIPDYWALPIGSTLARLGFWTVVATVVSVLIAEKRGFSGFLPVLAATAMGYIVTASQLRFPPYAFETSFPFFAMVWGYVGISGLSRIRAAARSPSRQSQLGAKIAALGLVAILLWYPVRREVKIVLQRYRDVAAWWHNPEQFYAHYAGVQFAIEHFPGKFKVIEELQKSLKSGDGVFVWGSDPLIYFITNRQPPTRFVSNLALISPWGPPAWREELIRDLRSSRPAFIVVAQNDQVPEIAFTRLDSEQFLSVYTSLGDFISASYQRVGEFPDFVLYRLKTEPKAP
jgi:hypothetical protein